MNKHCKRAVSLVLSLKLCTILLSFGFLASCAVTTVSFSTISVPEEGGINFVKITNDGDNVAKPRISSSNLRLGKIGKSNFEWWVNSMIALSPDGAKVAYINAKNNMQNIMVKSSSVGGPSVQRTFRNAVYDFSWSPKGDLLCFTEYRNNHFGVYLINSTEGSIVQQISGGTTHDYAGAMTPDESVIFFHRGEGYDNYSLWSFDRKTNLFSNYSRGMSPCLIPGQPNTIYCCRYTDKKECEIWKINFTTGVEEVILTQPGKSFTTPKLSPDGKWILCTGSSVTEKNKVQNTDIFAVRTDGSQLTQLTYHPGNDLSAIWSPDGKSIYFLSQRGSTEKKYNVWKMDFNL